MSVYLSIIQTLKNDLLNFETLSRIIIIDHIFTIMFAKSTSMVTPIIRLFFEGFLCCFNIKNLLLLFFHNDVTIQFEDEDRPFLLFYKCVLLVYNMNNPFNITLIIIFIIATIHKFNLKSNLIWTKLGFAL